MSAMLEPRKRALLAGRIGNLGGMLDRLPAGALAMYLVGAVVLTLLLTPVGVIGGDSPSLAYLPASILRWGSLNLDAFVNQDPLFDLSRQPHYIVLSNGHYYSKFSPVPSLLALPLYAPYIWLGGALDGQMYLILSWVAAVLIAAAVTALLFFALRRLVAQWQALLLAMVYAFGTYTWFAASHTLASQSSGELFLILAVLQLLRIEDAERERGGAPLSWYALAGLAVGLAVAARLNTLLVALLLSAYVGWRAWGNRAALASYAAGVGVVALLLAAYNQYAFGSPLQTGYGGEAGNWSTPIWVGLPGILVSPGHGLLMYSPALLLAAVGGWVAWRAPAAAAEDYRYGMLGRVLTTACLAQLLLMSHWWAWHGGNAYSQRMLQEVHPLLVLLLGFALWRYLGSRWFVVLLIGAAIWAIMLNIARMTFYQPWEERFQSELVWSLRNAELVMYVRTQGVSGFVAGMARTMLRIALALVLPAALAALVVLRHTNRRGHSPREMAG